MNRKELISSVSSLSDMSKKDTSIVIEAVLETIHEALKNGEKVEILGFGSFSVAERSARKGRNPQTGEEIEIKASKSPTFKAGKALKDAVKNS